MTCWEIFSLGRIPYPGIENHEILDHISSGGRLKKPSLCPEEMYVQLHNNQSFTIAPNWYYESQCTLILQEIVS